MELTVTNRSSLWPASGFEHHHADSLHPLCYAVLRYCTVASTIGFMPCNTVDVAFGTPVLLSALIGHGWQGVVVQIIGLALATLVYIPFMIVANKQAEAEQAAQN